MPSETISLRAYVGVMWLMYIVLGATYTGNLIAFLTVTKVENPINNLEDLVKHPEYKTGVIGDSAHQNIFEVGISRIINLL